MSDIVIEVPGSVVIEINSGGGNGLSAYDLAVAQGYVGTLDQWLESLKGAPGSGGAVDRTISTTAPSGIPLNGQEWVVVDP